MSDKDLEAIHDKNALPGLILEGVVSIDEVVQGIALGDYTGRWVIEQVFARAGLKPTATSEGAFCAQASTFDTPQAMAAMHCLEALIQSPVSRKGLVSYIWKSVACRHQVWLTMIASRLSSEAVLLLALCKPEASAYRKGILTPSRALLGRISSIPDQEMVDFAHQYACFKSLYELTKSKAVLEAALPSERDKIIAGDLGL